MKAAITVEGADEVAKIFKELGRQKDLSRAYRKVSKEYEPIARAGASGGTRQQRAMEKSIKASSTARSAVINISNAVAFPPSTNKDGSVHVKKPGGAGGAFMGGLAKRWPQWVGNNWQLPESGPYTFRGSFTTAEPVIIRTLEDEVYSLFRERGIEVTT